MSKQAVKIDNELARIASRLGMEYGNANASALWELRRASMTLTRWFERECGDSNEYASFCVERDAATAVPYQVRISHRDGRTTKCRIPDLEKGARKRIAETCARLGLQYYIQTDPRGASLYVSREALTDANYSRVGYAIHKFYY